MRILAIGDIVGENAVLKIEQELEKIKEQEKIDFVIANSENACKGNGLSKELYKKLILSGVNIITMGNHTWGNKEIYEFIENKNIIRPANITKGMPGKGYTIYELKGKKIAVINLIGNRYMQGVYYPNNPFTEVDEILEKIGSKANVIMVDFHAQSTGEKFLMAYYLDGRVSAVYGTHTHVQTADERIMPKGTAFITDIGMTGAIFSDLGCNPEVGLKRHIKDMTLPDEVSNNPIQICGCIFDFDDVTGKVKEVKRFNGKI